FLDGRALCAKVPVESTGHEQDKTAAPRRPDNKSVRLKLREKQTFSGTYLKNFIFDVRINLALENVKQLVLALVHMWGRFSAWAWGSLNQREASTGILTLREKC